MRADFRDDSHREAVAALTDAYARDDMGGGRPLDLGVQRELVRGLSKFPTAVVFLAYDDNVAVGIATCILGFSTFQAAPLMNVHDLAVMPTHRGRGIGEALLSAVEGEARERGCCKLTLEVLSANPARRLYHRFGFDGAMEECAPGGTLFCTKDL